MRLTASHQRSIEPSLTDQRHSRLHKLRLRYVEICKLDGCFSHIIFPLANFLPVKETLHEGCTDAVPVDDHLDDPVLYPSTKHLLILLELQSFKKLRDGEY